MNIYIVMPAYNEGERVLPVLKELSKLGYHFKKPVRENVGVFEKRTKSECVETPTVRSWVLHKVIVVDDGSSDNSKSKIKNSKFKNIVLLEHKINLGKGGALTTGCEYAFSHGADAVIMMDADGQHAAGDLPKFVEKLNTGKYDVVFGSRNLGMGMPFIRFVGNKIASVLVNLMFGIYVSDLVSGYRALTKNAYKKAKWSHSRPPGYGVETEMIIRIKKANLKYCEIPVETIYFDNYKGVSILDAFGVFMNLIYWKFKIK